MKRPICKYPKLKGKIVEMFGSIERFSAQMNITPTTIGAKLNGKSPWKLPEIDLARNLLNIPECDTHIYF